MASSLFSRRKPRHRHRSSSPVITASTTRNVSIASTTATSTTLGDFSRIFASLCSDQASSTSSITSTTSTSFDETHQALSTSFQPHLLTPRSLSSSRVLFFIPDYVIRETMASKEYKEPKLILAKETKAISNPKAKITSTKPRSYVTATTSFPTSPPPSGTPDDSAYHSDSASSVGDFDPVDLDHDGGVALPDIDTSPTTPPQQVTFPGLPGGMDLAGERLLKKQLAKRPLVLDEETLITRLAQRFGAHDQYLREKFPEHYARGGHLFEDGSNITVSFYNALKNELGMDKKEHLPAFFDLSAFQTVLERNRPIMRRYIAGSRNKWGVEPQYLRQARRNGFETKVYDRVRKYPLCNANASSDSEEEYRRTQMREQGVDELVHLGMSESILDNIGKPGIMIVVTGDGNVGEYSGGFPSFVERALNFGWIVEVYSFDDSSHSIWRDPSFMDNEKWKGRLSYHSLDSFIHDFIDVKSRNQIPHLISSATALRFSNKSKKVKIFKPSVYVPAPIAAPRHTVATKQRVCTPAVGPVQTSPVCLPPPIPTPSPQGGFTGGEMDYFGTHTQQLAINYTMASFAAQCQASSRSYPSPYEQNLGGYNYAAALAGNPAMRISSPSWARAGTCTQQNFDA